MEVTIAATLRNRPHLRIFLLGKPYVQQNGTMLSGLGGRKTQELLGYLVVHRHRPHVREKLAELLWSDKSPSQSKRYLRQALWQIQSTLNEGYEDVCDLIRADSDWLQINPDAGYWSDVGQLEEIASNVRDVQGADLTADLVREVKTAVGLYRGDLLENCYGDWCLLERERLQNSFLDLLDKLMDYCLVHQEYGTGVRYGRLMLRFDIARERTYRKLMRLHYLNHDRTGALRHYWRCCRALDQEFGVQPARQTVALFECIRDDQPLKPRQMPVSHSEPAPAVVPDPADILKRLDQYTASMLEAQEKLQRDVAALRAALRRQE